MPTKKEILNSQAIQIDKMEKELKLIMILLDKLSQTQSLMVEAISAIAPKKKVSKGLKQ